MKKILRVIKAWMCFHDAFLLADVLVFIFFVYYDCSNFDALLPVCLAFPFVVALSDFILYHIPVIKEDIVYLYTLRMGYNPFEDAEDEYQ